MATVRKINSIKLSPANKNDIFQLISLINKAYRGEEGWTKENEIIAGDRLSEDDLKKILNDKNSFLFVMRDKQYIISSICIEKRDNYAYIGLFAVKPQLQTYGLGKQVLAFAEQYIKIKLQQYKVRIAVVSQRDELIAYYERRGYKRIGKIERYPLHLAVGKPKKENLTIEYLEKNL